MQIQAVIFDMDGLLLNTEPVYIEYMGKAVSEYGYTLTDELIKDCTGVPGIQIEKALMDHFGPDFPAELVNRKHREYTYEHFRSRGVTLKRGVIFILNRLDELSLPTGLATSTVRNVAEDLLEKAGVSGRFQAAVFGDQINQGKPHPDIFLEAAFRLSVDPEKCLVFEDSDNGIRAASEAGMRAVLIPDILKPPKEIRELAYAEYPDLIAAGQDLQKLLG